MLAEIKTFAMSNPTLAGFVGVYFTGLLTFICKGVPIAIFKFIKKHITTTFSIGNANISFYNLMELFESDGLVNKTRLIKVFNGRWGYDESVTKGLGVGGHWFIYKGVPLFINISIEPSTDCNEKLTISLTKLGRSHKLFDQLLIELSNKINHLDNEHTNIFKWKECNWGSALQSPIRQLNTVLIDNYNKNLLLNTINHFIESEQWYINNGIPYQLGILLYGPPGTGKTSLIRAIAGYFNYSISTLPVSSLEKIGDALGSLHKNSFLVIEDIDSSYTVHSRSNDEKDKSNTTKAAYEEIAKSGLSDVLNSIDGFLSKHGRILIMTTNHIEKIDAALIRPGRIDLKVELGYATSEMFIEFIHRFFPTNKIPNNFKYDASELTMAELQNELLLKKDFTYFINKYGKLIIKEDQ